MKVNNVSKEMFNGHSVTKCHTNNGNIVFHIDNEKFYKKTGKVGRKNVYTQITRSEYIGIIK